MITARSLLFRFGAIVLAHHFGLACAQAQGLRHDLFARPALGNMQPARTGAGQTGAATDATPAWNPEVNAVVVAGSDSLANVDGAIVRIGGEIDGYRLVEVREREVVFVKGKKRYTLALGSIKGPDAAREPQARGAAQGADAAREAPPASNVKAAEAAPEAPTTANMKSPGVLPEPPTTGSMKSLDTSKRGSQ